MKLMKDLVLTLSKVLSTLILASASAMAMSQTSSLDAHVHGEAELMIAIENSNIEMQFVSPAANIYGFEHEPSTDEQLDAVARAEDVFSHTDELFVFEGANCGLSEVELDLPYVELVAAASHDEHEEHHEEHGHDEHHEEHAHEEHEHDDHHNKHASEDHHDEHEHHHEHDEHETHSEISVALAYECDSSEVQAIQAAFLAEFPAIESLDVQWISDSGQGATELTAESTSIDLR